MLEFLNFEELTAVNWSFFFHHGNNKANTNASLPVDVLMQTSVTEIREYHGKSVSELIHISDEVIIKGVC